MPRPLPCTPFPRAARLLLLPLVTLLPASPRAVADVPRNEQAVADVAAGRVDTARASWWGFDDTDATGALQAAIHSRARRVVIDNTGSPWRVTTISLPSDKEIVWEAGTVVEAQRGKFLGKGDCLFVASGQQNLTLRGEDATLRMHKQDYQNPPYEPAEWRHALEIRGCRNVTVEGLTFQNSGGDGIYLGAGRDGATNTDITIRRVVCVDNHRQGISVITAENLLIEDSTFRGTRGTAPQAGIDFEPNRPDERLVNCVLRNCHSEDNAGCGYLIYLGPLSRASTPVSLRFEQCTSQGCQQPSVYIGIANSQGLRSVTGRIEFADCRFDADAGGGLIIRGNETDGCQQRFVRCEIIRRDQHEKHAAPIIVEAPRSLEAGTGNIELSQCTVRDAIARQPIALIASPLAGLPGISGSLTSYDPAGERCYTIDASQLAAWFPGQGRVDQIVPYEFSWPELSWPDARPAATDAPAAQLVDEPPHMFHLRGEADLLVWGQAGEAVELLADLGTVAAHPLAEGNMTLVAPDGTPTQLVSAAHNGHTAYRFTPPASGTYCLQWRSGPHATFTPLRCAVPWALLQPPRGLHLFRCTGQLQFAVPAGVTRFALQVSGEGSAETVKATLRDAAGEVRGVQDNIAAPHVFVPQRDQADMPEVWTLTLENASTGVLEDVTIQTLGIPPVFAARQGHMFQARPGSAEPLQRLGE